MKLQKPEAWDLDPQCFAHLEWMKATEPGLEATAEDINRHTATTAET